MPPPPPPQFLVQRSYLYCGGCLDSGFKDQKHQPLELSQAGSPSCDAAGIRGLLAPFPFMRLGSAMLGTIRGPGWFVMASSRS